MVLCQLCHTSWKTGWCKPKELTFSCRHFLDLWFSVFIKSYEIFTILSELFIWERKFCRSTEASWSLGIGTCLFIFELFLNKGHLCYSEAIKCFFLSFASTAIMILRWYASLTVHFRFTSFVRNLKQTLFIHFNMRHLPM